MNWLLVSDGEMHKNACRHEIHAQYMKFNTEEICPPQQVMFGTFAMRLDWQVRYVCVPARGVCFPVNFLSGSVNCSQRHMHAIPSKASELPNSLVMLFSMSILWAFSLSRQMAANSGESNWQKDCPALSINLPILSYLCCALKP